MTTERQKTSLVLSAIELTRLGTELEAARQELRQLVETGTPYESVEMKAALFKCQSLALRWNTLEAAHFENADQLK